MATKKIAIDGPSGAGKSTISRYLADELGYNYVDTGAMYRAVAVYAVKNNIDVNKDIKLICSKLDDINIDMRRDGSNQLIYLNGEDITESIRLPEISVVASDVSKIPEIRMKLVVTQREIADKYDVVMDGRDIGTHVLPNADVKIFLTASLDDRAARRFDELCRRGTGTSFDEVKNDMAYRDKNDSGRDFAPLKQADDAVLIDTTGNDLSTSKEIVLEKVRLLLT